MTRKRLSLAVLLLSGMARLAVAGDLEDLLHQVQDAKAREERIDEERKARFLADKNQQQKLLNETKAALAKAEADSKALRSEFSANETRITELRAELKKQGGNLNELFAKAREFAVALSTDLENSLVSAQFPGRVQSLELLISAREVPNITQLEQLWLGLLQEMTESGQVTKYHGKYTTKAGVPRETEIVRLGAFTVIADGKYLRYAPETGQLAEMPVQPPRKFLTYAQNLGKSGDGFVKVAIDPALGGVLENYTKQGATAYPWLPRSLHGLISTGVDIAVIGVLLLSSIWALGVAFERWMFYRRVDVRAYPNRIALETDLTQHLTIIGTVAANAPFVGLLGTVIGIMMTFQKMGVDKHMDVHSIMIGLSTALKATAMGLLVAIPCVILNNFLRRRIRVMVTAYETPHGS